MLPLDASQNTAQRRGSKDDPLAEEIQTQAEMQSTQALESKCLADTICSEMIREVVEREVSSLTAVQAKHITKEKRLCSGLRFFSFSLFLQWCYS